MGEQMITRWAVPLAGHHFDLEDLPGWFAAEDVRIEPWRECFALMIPTSLIGECYEPIRAFANEQLELVNGVGRLLKSSYRPVSLTNALYGIDAAGVVRHTVVAAAGSAKDGQKPGQ